MLGFNSISEQPISALPVAAAGGNVTVETGLGSLIITGFVALVSVSDNQVVSPGVGQLDLNGFVPTVSVSNNQTASPGVGSLILNGFVLPDLNYKYTLLINSLFMVWSAVYKQVFLNYFQKDFLIKTLSLIMISRKASEILLHSTISTL